MRIIAHSECSAAGKLDAGLALARAGFNIFPIVPNGKRPAIAGWQIAACANENQIEAWAKDIPGCNWGIPTGDKNNGLTVVDIDPRNGGAETYKSLNVVEEFTPTRGVRTAGKGVHCYYRSAERLKSKAGALGPGVDIKSHGGYVVGPGSVVNGKPYEWVKADKPIADLPAWIAPRVETVATRTAAAGKRLVDENDEAVALARRYIETAPEAIEGQGGNDTTFRIAARLFDFGVSRATALDLMLEWNETHAFPPWELNELETIIGSAERNRTKPIGVQNPENASGFEAMEIDEDKNLRVPISEPLVNDSKRTPKGEALDGAKGGGGLATRWNAVDPANIQAREWPVPDVLCKRNVAALAGPSSAGKTTWYLTLALAMVTGRGEIIGLPIHKRSRVWFWNQEDDQSELDRRLTALMIAFNIKPEDLLDENGESMLWINSGVERPFQLAWMEGDRRVKRGQSVDHAIADIKKFGIDAFLMDPTIEFHDSNENDNVQMRKVLSFAREIAVKAQCAVGVGTHTPKPDRASSKSYAGDLNAIRGGGAQGGVVRIVHTLFGASESDAKEWNMPRLRMEYVRLDMAKNNLGRKWTEPRWFKFESVPVGMIEESVGVLRPVELERRVKSGGEHLGELLARTISETMRRPGEFLQLREVIAAMADADSVKFGDAKNRTRFVADQVFNSATEILTELGKLSLVVKERAPAQIKLAQFKTEPEIEQDGDNQ